MTDQLDRIEAMLIRVESKLDALIEGKKKSKPAAAKKLEYSDEFERFWKLYPKRAGSNPKNQAYGAWKQRLKEVGKASYEGELHSIMAGTRRYAKYCEATGKVNTEYTMQAVRFLGPSKEYDLEWNCPLRVEKVPANNEKALEWGKSRGMTPRPGEEMYDFRRRLEMSL